MWLGDCEGHPSMTGYSRREVHFLWAHIEEYIELNEGHSGEAGRRIRDALRHEWQTLSEGIICSCKQDQPIAESIGGQSRPSGRTPNLALADIKAAYKALPMASLARTRLYLLLQPTHSPALRHMKGQPCAQNWAGDNTLTGELGHLVRLSETQVAELGSKEFEARHRRRVALESFMQPARAQDGWPEPMDAYAYMADYLNKGEAEFLEDADWAHARPRRTRRDAQVAA